MKLRNFLVAMGMAMLSASSYAQFNSGSNYNTANMSYQANSMLSQNIVFDSAMQAGGTFDFSVNAHAGGGRNNQHDTGNLRLQFYNSSGGLVTSAQTNYSQNLIQADHWSSAPGDNPAPWSTISLSYTLSAADAANTAYVKVTMIGTDASWWAGNYGPQWQMPTLTFNGGSTNILYNPEFGVAPDGVQAQGWASSTGYSGVCGTVSGSAACVTNATGVTANMSGGGYSATGGSTTGTAGGYSSTLTSTTILATVNNGGVPPAGSGSGSTTPNYVTVLSNTNVTSITPTSNNSPAGEGAANALDGNSGTKYLNFDRANAGFTIKLDTPRVIRGITFTTANDFEARDPSKYSLFGSNDGVNWTTIVDAASITLSSNRLTTTSRYDITNNDAYYYYFITFPSIKAIDTYGSVAGCQAALGSLACDSVQIADVTYYYDTTYTTYASVTDTGTGTIANPGTAGSVSSLTPPGPVAITNNSGSTGTNPSGTTTLTVTNAGTYTNDGVTGNVTNSGTFTNNGTTGDVTNSGTFNNNGTTSVVDNQIGGIFNNNIGGTTGNVTNAGTFNNSGTTGTVANSGIFTNNSGGTTQAVTNNATGTFDNYGTVTTVTNNGTFNNKSTGATGSVTNDNTFNNDGTTGSVINNGGFANNGSTGVVTNNGLFINSVTGTAGNVTNSGTFNNAGTTGAVTNTGVFNNNTGGTVSELAYNNHVVNNAGTITSITYNGGTVDNTGTIGSINNTEAHGTFHNTGTITGTVTTNSTFNNNAGGVVTGLYTNNGTLTNAGTTGDWINNSVINNSGTMANGTNNGTYTNTGTVGTVANTGTMTTSGTAGLITNTGTLNITGGTASVNNTSTLGVSSGTLGSYTQSAPGTTTMSINQPILVTGLASLGGSITINDVPTGYGRYTVMSAGGVTGTYDPINSTSNYLRYSLTDVRLYVTPDATATQASIDSLSKNISNITNLQSSMVSGSLGNDCSVFGNNGACVSVNVGGSKVGTGDLYTGGLTVGKKINDNWRFGVFTSAAANNSTIGTVTSNSDPVVGGFITWTKDRFSLQASAAQNRGSLKVTRVGPEIGTGVSNVDNQAYQIRGNYSFPLSESLTVTPYAGIRYTESIYGGYTETGPVFPLTVNSTSRKTTDVLAGVSVAKQLTDRLTASVSLGVTQRLSETVPSYTGSSEIGGLSTFNSTIPSNGRTNASIGAGINYAVDKNTRIGVSVGVQQRGDNANINSLGISITRGF